MKTILASLLLAATLVPTAFCYNAKEAVKKEQPSKQPAETRPETPPEEPAK